MTNLELELLKDEDALNIETVFPEIHSIWRPQAVSEAIFYTKAYARGEYRTGEIFFITVDKKRVGMTGYFLKENISDTAGLRWHGIVPSMRNKGYSLEAIRLVAERVISREPAIKYLSESVPLDRPEILEYFKKIGFSEWNDPEKAIDYTSVSDVRIKLDDLIKP